MNRSAHSSMYSPQWG